MDSKITGTIATRVLLKPLLKNTKINNRTGQRIPD